MDAQPNTCKCICHKAIGIKISLIGLVILLGNFGVLSAEVVGIAWPVLLILIGLKKSFGAGKCKCCSAA